LTQTRKLELTGPVSCPRTHGPRNGPSAIALMRAHDGMATNARD
jgi:hypothetical protein